jgi:hypothetical protein
MAKKEKWEYTVQEFKTENVNGLQSAINKYADEGWELVFVNAPFHYFKRVKIEKHTSIHDVL